MVKWSASIRWSFGPIFAWGSIETTTIGKTHSTLNLTVEPYVMIRNATNESNSIRSLFKKRSLRFSMIIVGHESIRSFEKIKGDSRKNKTNVYGSELKTVNLVQTMVMG